MTDTPDPTKPVLPKRRETENDRARKHGVPKWLKQYNAHYGKGGVEGIVACHLQNPAPMLGWVDEAESIAEQMAAGGHATGVFRDGKLVAADEQVYLPPEGTNDQA